MREMMKNLHGRSLLSWVVLILITNMAMAQMPPSGPGPQLMGRLYGKVVDAKTNKGIEAVSVQLLAASKDSLIGGMLTRPNGDFNFENLPVSDSIKVIISAVGAKEQQIMVSLGLNGAPMQKDLGNIKIEQDAQYLGNVTVVAQKPALQMGIDRKVFNADKSLTAAGGTAIDLMKNIPSVSVDVDGNVQLRNASPQVFVDGRPTILTLDQIPADNVERVELITNPSAKFDAASTGGIINVVLKKNKKSGLNGMASIGAGTPEILNGNLNINYRQGKVNLFASGGYNASGGKAKGETYRENKRDGITQDYFNQLSVNDRQNKFTNIRFGGDYFIDNRNTLSLTQNITMGRFNNEETQEQLYLNSSKVMQYRGDRLSDSRNQFDRFGTQLFYKHSFAHPGKELTADVNFNTGGGRNESSILNTYSYPDGSPFKTPNRVNNQGKNDNNQLTVQVDYVNPISENAKLETGVRSYINNFTSTFNAFSIAENGESTKLPLSNNYKYRETVNAFYITYSDKWKGIGYQAGLRAEQSRFDGELVDSAQKFGYDYPNSLNNIFDALFPSLFLTKEIGDGQQLQLNYSRRIRRPDFWRLNPFIDISDPVNLRQGNPALRPEFTNSFEFNYSNTYSTGNFLGVIYYRNNQGDITQYSDTISAEKYQQLNNAAVDPNAILNTFINAQSTNRLGFELTLQQKFGKGFDITPTFNMQYRKVNAVINSLDLSNEGFNWDAKLIANYKLSAPGSAVFNNLGFQAVGQYESPSVIPQGKRKEQYNVDLAIRKDFLKNNRGTLTFAINDVFNTRRFGVIYDTETFYQDFYRRRDIRSFKLTFAYKFGNPDFSLFKKGDKRPQHDDEDDDMGQQ